MSTEAFPPVKDFKKIKKNDAAVIVIFWRSEFHHLCAHIDLCFTFMQKTNFWILIAVQKRGGPTSNPSQSEGLRYSLLDWNINTPSTVYSHITPLSTRSPPFIECFLHHVPNPSNPPSPPHLKPRPSQQTDQEQHCRWNSISSRQVTTTWRFLLPVEVVKHSSRGPIPGSGTGTPATPPNSALHPSTQAF